MYKRDRKCSLIPNIFILRLIPPSLRLCLIVDAQPVARAAILVRVRRARHAAIRRGRVHRAGAEGVAAVALACVLDAKVVKAVAEARAALERHGVGRIADAAERAAGGGFGLAAVPCPSGADVAWLRGASACRCIVDIQL